MDIVVFEDSASQQRRLQAGVNETGRRSASVRDLKHELTKGTQCHTIGIMKIIRWNDEKNERLIQGRGICFEQALLILERDGTLDIVEHPNQEKYPGQKMAIVAIDGYAHLVPYVENDEEIFLKTIIPSRTATKKYLGENS